MAPKTNFLQHSRPLLDYLQALTMGEKSPRTDFNQLSKMGDLSKI